MARTREREFSKQDADDRSVLTIFNKDRLKKVTLGDLLNIMNLSRRNIFLVKAQLKEITYTGNERAFLSE